MTTNIDYALRAGIVYRSTRHQISHRPGLLLVNAGWAKRLALSAFFLVCMAAAPGGAFATGRDVTTWQEEALQHDGSKIVVQRTVQRGGRREPGQEPPIREQSLSFTLPGTQRTVRWDDPYAPDLGGANFNVKLMEVVNGTPYVLASPAGCLAYNKWDRPNPPYVIFRFGGTDWRRIPLGELPAVITKPNLNGSSPDDVVRQQGKSYLSAEDVAQLNAGYRQPEFRRIVREPVPPGADSTSCETLVRYKCGWGAPGEFNQKYFESTCK